MKGVEFVRDEKITNGKGKYKWLRKIKIIKKRTFHIRKNENLFFHFLRHKIKSKYDENNEQYSK